MLEINLQTLQPNKITNKENDLPLISQEDTITPPEKTLPATQTNSYPSKKTNTPFKSQDDTSPPQPRMPPRRQSDRTHASKQNNSLPACISQQSANSIFHDTETCFLPTCNAVVHPVTKETITKYKDLAEDPVTASIWTEAMCKELGQLSQGYKNTKGTNTVRFINHQQIREIPKE